MHARITRIECRDSSSGCTAGYSPDMKNIFCICLKRAASCVFGIRDPCLYSLNTCAFRELGVLRNCQPAGHGGVQSAASCPLCFGESEVLDEEL